MWPEVPTVACRHHIRGAAGLNLPSVVAVGVAHGRWLNEATASQPVAVLGAAAAQRLGFDRVTPGRRVWLGGQWFYVAGILQSALLATELDSSVLIGYPAAQHYLDYVEIEGGKAVAGPPSKLYVRADTDRVAQVQAVLAQTANPESPSEVDMMTTGFPGAGVSADG